MSPASPLSSSSLRSFVLTRASSSPQHEWFCHIVISTRFKSEDDIRVLSFGRDHDDRRWAEPTDRAANLDPIFAGEHQIEKNQIRAISSGDEYSIIAIGSRDRRVVLPTKVGDESITQRPIILDHQNSGNVVGPADGS